MSGPSFFDALTTAATEADTAEANFRKQFDDRIGRWSRSVRSLIAGSI